MLNNVVLMGRIIADAELKHTGSGIPVTKFCIAVARRYQKDGERITDFINCVAWRETAEFICRYFRKGDPLAVIGEIQTRKYTDRDGNNRTAFEVLVNQATFCGGKKNEENPQENAEAVISVYDDDDLPF